MGMVLVRDYDHLAALWQLEKWISLETAQQARTHYAAYSVQRQDGLRIITINTDFCASSYSFPCALSINTYFDRVYVGYRVVFTVSQSDFTMQSQLL